VSAGVAVARMPATPQLLKQALARGASSDGTYPSYRVPLTLAHGLWKNHAHQAGREFVQQLVLRVVPQSQPGEPPAACFDVRPAVWHALPLIGEAVLLEMEAGELKPAQVLLEELRPLAREFRDYDTLGRIGRLFKDAGDRKWESAAIPFDQFHNQAGCQMYRKALVVYEEAFLATADWYAGINAATLALLTHDLDKARLYAGKVAETCSALLDHEKKDRYWMFATEGEAALVLGEAVSVAVDFYQNALDELSPGQWGMANSTYKQACRLWKALGEERVGPVLALFEASDARGCLSPNYLGRPFSGDPS